MVTLRETIEKAREVGKALGHFNISDTEQFWGVFNAARALKLPVIIGVSEGERDFIGVRQIAALVKATREEFQYPLYLNADHTYTFERVKEAVDAGFDAVIFDGTELPFEKNVEETKRSVAYAKAKNPDLLVEGELGFIGKSSKLLDTLPKGSAITEAELTKPEELKIFVEETGVDLAAPAVGNLHGMLKSGKEPALNISRIKELAAATNAALVLHGGSGTSNEDFVAAIKAGVSIIHINTEIRLAYRKGIQLSLGEDLEEIAPYRFMKGGVLAVQKIVTERLKLFNGLQ